MNHIARAQPLFSSLILLFSDVPVAVALVFWLPPYLYTWYAVRPRMLLARCVDVFVEDLFMCRFVSKTKAKEDLQPCGDAFFDILISKNVKRSKGVSVLAMFNVLPYFNRSFNRRQMSPAEKMKN